jgi:hypothetical protein
VTERGSRTRVLRELRRLGLLLVTDPVLPSVAGLVAGEPVHGSWWAHPKGHEIFQVLESIEEDEALVVKLVAKKQTLVHRSLWPELFAVATSGADWQTSGLDPGTRALWNDVERDGTIELFRIAKGAEGGRKDASRRARDLEERLLVHGSQVHTATGAHEKILSSWAHVATTIGVRLPGTDGDAGAARARAEIERRTAGKLPWRRRGEE